MQKINSGSLLLSTILMLAPIDSFAADHWVESDDDIRDLIDEAIVQPGDTVIWRNGEYEGMGINLNFMGTEEGRITLRAETPGRVILKGESFVKFGGDYLTVDGLIFYNGDNYLRDVSSAAVQFRASNGNRHAHFCRLTNSAVIDYNSWEQDVDDDDDDGDREEFIYASSKWVQIYGTNNRVDHCHFSKKLVRGALIITELVPQDGEDGTPYESYNHRIDHNFFGPNPVGWASNEFETVRLGTSDYSNYNGNIVVENNHSYHCDGEIEVISNKSSYNTIRNNILVRCKGSIVSRHGDFANLDGNIILGQGRTDTGGIRINGEGHILTNNYVADTRGSGLRGALVLRAAGSVDSDDTNGGYEEVRNAFIAHNTFINNQQSWNLGELGGKDNNLPARDSRLANNLVVGNTRPLVTWGRAPEELIYENIIFWGTEVGLEDDGIFNVDPELVERTDRLFTPGPEGPAIDGGIAIESVGLDMDGQSRSVETPEIGADESLEAGALLAPLSPISVGPNWSPQGFPVASAGIRLSGSSEVALQIPEPGRFGYGFYNVEISKDLSSWTSALPNAVDVRDGDNLSETELDYDREAGDFWRVIFKSVSEE